MIGKTWQKWLAFGPAAAWYIFIFWLSSQPKLPGPTDNLLEFIWFKMAHLIFYAIFTFLVIEALRRAISWQMTNYRWFLLLAFWIVVLLAGFDELHQGLVPGRHMRLRDVLIDAAAAAAVIWANARYNRASKP